MCVQLFQRDQSSRAAVMTWPAFWKSATVAHAEVIKLSNVLFDRPLVTV